MAFSSSFLNPVNWCGCCKCSLWLCTSKYLSILGVATCIIFPFSYYLYHLLKSHAPSKEKSSESTRKHAKYNKFELFLQDKAFKNTANSFPLIFNRNGLLNFTTIKKIYYLTVVACQDDLSRLRKKLLLLRRNFFGNLDKYLEITVLLYREYAAILEKSLQNLLTLRKIDREMFETSVLLNENQGFLRRDFLRDAAWSVISESYGKTLAKELMKEYILTQIQDLKRQKENCRGFLKQLPGNLRKIVISSRADDLAFAKLGVDEMDYVKSLRNFVKDEEINRLIGERNRVLLEE